MRIRVSNYPKTLENIRNRVEYLARTYADDMAPYRDLSVAQIFGVIAAIPYKPDPPGDELIMRPRVLLLRQAGDCDDKTVAGCAWFIMRGIQTGYSLVGQYADRAVHHIFTRYRIDGQWHDFDATYADNILGEARRWAKRFDYVIG